MKFKQYLNERYDDYEDDEEERDVSHANGALKAYIQDPTNKHWLTEFEDELIDMYGNDKPLKLYRGLNFDTKEDYEKFMNKISNGKIKIENGSSSWTRSLSTAKQFAKTKPSYMEFMSTDKMKMISKAQKENEYVVGYRGIILEIDIGKNEGVDTSKSKYAAEDEIIIFKGEYKCKYHEFKKNSDRIKEEGIEAILDEIEKLQDDNEESERYNSILIKKIINDHKSELTEEMKSFFGRRFLKDIPRLGFYHKNNSFVNDKNELIVSMQSSPLIIYGENIFNKPDVEKYISNSYKEQSKSLKKLKIEIEKLSDDNVVKWNIDEPNKWFKLIGLEKEYLELFKKFGKKYKELNSKSKIDDINKLTGKDQQNAIDDFAKSLKDLIKSMGAK